MASDSRLWTHHLGEASTSFQRCLLKASLPVCLLIAMSTSNIQARVLETENDSWNKVTASVNYEKPAQGSATESSDSSQPRTATHVSSPSGRWSDRSQQPIMTDPEIQRYIRYYAVEGRTTFSEALERSWPLLPIMTNVLEANGVPAEMASVVLVESSFKRHAAYRGAGGYWQMLAATARAMGLRVDRWVDERQDPVKSTRAAAKYFRLLYAQFHSWPMVLAAYNAGQAPVSRAVKRGGAKDFWQLSRRGGLLPRKVNHYVPKVLAAAEMMRNREVYGFESPPRISIHDYESVSVHSALKLQQIAEWLDMSVSELQDMNPALRLDRLPPDSKIALNLPSGTREKFDLAYASYIRK